MKKMMKRFAPAGVMLFASALGQAYAGVGSGVGADATGSSLAMEDGEISFAFTEEAGSTHFPAKRVEVQLIHENCMKRVLRGVWLVREQVIKGPLEQKLSFLDTAFACNNDTGVAEWAVTVLGGGGEIGTCKIGYARYADDGRRFVVAGRHGNGPYCPLMIRATCNAGNDDCMAKPTPGTGPVRVEFSPSAPLETVPVERARVSPF